MNIYYKVLICCFISISVKAQTDIEIRFLKNEENLVYAISMSNQLIERVNVSNASSVNSFILGESILQDDCILFIPVVPFDEGGDYILHYYSKKNKAFQQHPFKINIDSSIPHPRVKNIYPTAFSLPENLLRFYVEFDQPMREDNFLEYVKLLDENGNNLTGVFLPSRHEYWNQDRTKITLIFDPGRVKTGLIAHETLGGRVLKNGKQYSLVITNGCLSMQGKPLKTDFIKNFEIIQEDMRKIDPHIWKVNTPRVNSRELLIIDFFRHIDHINAVTHITILDPLNNEVVGKYNLCNNERTLSFIPNAPWQNLTYKIIIDMKLEDVCGNNLIHGFDVYKASEISAKAKEKFKVIEFTPR